MAVKVEVDKGVKDTIKTMDGSQITDIYRTFTERMQLKDYQDRVRKAILVSVDSSYDQKIL